MRHRRLLQLLILSLLLLVTGSAVANYEDWEEHKRDQGPYLCGEGFYPQCENYYVFWDGQWHYVGRECWCMAG
jgi:hypothetical protein